MTPGLASHHPTNLVTVNILVFKLQKWWPLSPAFAPRHHRHRGTHKTVYRQTAGSLAGRSGTGFALPWLSVLLPFLELRSQVWLEGESCRRGKQTLWVRLGFPGQEAQASCSSLF